MKIALVAPSHVPFVIGGAEKMWWALQQHINTATPHDADVIRLPTPEHDFWSVLDSYKMWSQLRLDHFDMVISGKYPCWMVDHPNHVVWQLHCLRGLYDTYHHFSDIPKSFPQAHPIVGAIARHARSRRGDPASLEAFFVLLEDLRAAMPELPPEIFRFPGPLLRELIHYLDSVGLSRQRIKRYAAISDTVRQRRSYRPDGVDPEVALVPSDLKSLSFGHYKHFLIVSRLEAAKRIDLSIRAMRLAKTQTRLKIIGHGPDEERLRNEAAEDPRIQFMGYLNDGELEALYRDALAIIFHPIDEDFGIITCEAMGAGKLVITTRDAGGPNELVRNGVNGYSVAPEAEALAEMIDKVADDPVRASVMGRRAHFDSRGVSWRNVTSVLIGESSVPAPLKLNTMIKRRRRLLVASTFACHPVRSGGQARHFQLLCRAARDFDVTYLALVHHEQEMRAETILPGLHQICIPASRAQHEQEMALSAQIDWVPVSDMAAPILHHLTDSFQETMERLGRDADLFGAFHPFLAPALQAAANRPLWHDSANVEARLKASMLPDTQVAQDLVALTRQVERIAVNDAVFVSACSEDDAAGLCAEYGPRDIAVVPNGVDVGLVPVVLAPEREAMRHKLIEKLAGTHSEVSDLALFLGSWHDPNVKAVEKLAAIAPQFPHIGFLIVGSVCNAFAEQELPPNVLLIGIVDDPQKSVILGACSVAFNPVPYGGGTNVKMLDYFSAGLPVLTTPEGARGLGELVAGSEFLSCPFESFADGVKEMLELDVEARHRMAEKARRGVEMHFDWDVIYSRLRNALPAEFLPPGKPARDGV